MAQTYIPELLVQGVPTQLEWGVAWYRFLANDKPVNGVYPTFSLEDSEIEALLQVTSLVVEGVRYYMPHEAVIIKVLSDPTYAVSVSEEGYSQTFVSPNKLAENIRSLASRHFLDEYPEELAEELGFTRIRLTPRF